MVLGWDREGIGTVLGRVLGWCMDGIGEGIGDKGLWILGMM